jgi:hypothetical protein
MSTIEPGRTGRKMDSDRQTMTVEEAARTLGDQPKFGV